MEYGTRVLDTAPAMFRHLNLSLPVRIETDGSTMAAEIADAILDSPRFHSDERGYPIKVRVNAEELVATFSSPQQALLAEVSVPAIKKVKKKAEGEEQKSETEEEEEEILDPPDELVALFHKKAFAPRLDLSQSEINSLDGSTLTDSRRNNDAREAIGLPSLRPGDRPASPEDY